MSARDRRRRSSPRDDDFITRAGTPMPNSSPSETSWAETERSSAIPPYALVPLRVFLGITFLYAGLDKLLDPAFLNGSGPGSIGAQMVAFAHGSPLGPLVIAFGEPFPIAVGLGISLAEIAVGVGALTGLLFRASAALGAALAIMFWLTASWAIKPYYYGPDLPYAAGWITLALAGTGGKWTMREWLPVFGSELTPYDLHRRRIAASRGRPPPDPGEDVTRRAVLEAGLLGGVAILLASVAGVVGFMHRSPAGRQDVGSTSSQDPAAAASAPGGVTSDPIAGGSAPVASAQGGSASIAPTARPTGRVIGTLDHLTRSRQIGFDDPATGDPGAVLLLANGKVVAFDLVCTHAGCTVEYDPSSRLLICPCHGATFDPAHGARPIAGPTDQPLASVPIRVDTTTGEIRLTS
jgi:thiosulfate dehydrogenase [quinone] large subunit